MADNGFHHLSVGVDISIGIGVNIGIGVGVGVSVGIGTDTRCYLAELKFFVKKVLM